MQFEIIEDACEATRMVAQKSDQLGDKLQSHVKLIPRAIMANPDRDFSDLRLPYYEQEAKRMAEDPEA